MDGEVNYWNQCITLLERVEAMLVLMLAENEDNYGLLASAKCHAEAARDALENDLK